MTSEPMRMLRLRHLLALSLFLLPSAATAQAPSVDKVEPPYWWVGMRWDPVQLMLYGDDLDGLTARFVEGGPEVRAVHTLPNASHAFVDVHVPERLAPGTYTLELTRGGETTAVAYELRARPGAEGRYQGFGPEDVVYLITPDRFANGDAANDRVAGLRDEYDPDDPRARHGGDLRGLIDRLDYLADLGVTALWLNPVLENSGRNSYHGYAATDYYRVDPRLGTNADYRELVEEAHRRGLKVIFDHVNNHIGIGHPWVADPPTPTWLNGTPEEHLSDKHYKLAVTDPYADPEIVEHLRTFWFVDAMPDLNQRDPFLADYLIQNTLWWIEDTGLDGLREDTYPYPDQAFLARWAEAVLDEYPRFNIVGEIWEVQPAYLAQFQRRSLLPRNFETNLPSVMDFALTEAWRRYLRGEDGLKGVYEVLSQDFVYSDPDNLMTFVDNHDMTRAIYEAGGDAARVKQVLAMLLTTRGIPQILYGTEIGMVGGASHVELRADMPGGFPGDARDAFSPSGRTPAEQDMFAYLQRLLHLRRDHPALTEGRLVHYPPTWGRDVYRYVRATDDEAVLVVVNGHDEARRADLTELARWFTPQSRFTDLMTGETFAVDVEGGVPVPPRGVRILRF